MNLFAILLNNFILLIFSISLNIFLLAAIKLGALGLQLRTILNDLLEKRIYLIPIFSLLIFITMKYYSNIIFLDPDEITVSTTIDNINFQISGEALTQIYRNIGSASVFAVGARIAAGLVAKHPMGLIPKVGTIGGVGSLFTINYRIIMDSFNQEISQSHGNVSISGPVKITLGKIEHLDKNSNISELITSAFNPERSMLGDYSTRLQFKKETIYNIWKNKNEILLSDSNIIDNSKILKTLDQYNPNWKDSFISSPLEPTDYIINTLNNNLMLDYIILYLLFMLLIILSCKFVIREDIDSNSIKKYLFIDSLSNLIKKYITIWKKSSNIWIYFILISIMISEIISIYSINNILLILK
jgi:hypothetical protein